MTVQEIQKALKSRFINHKYDLQNSYVFERGWECDYFSMTKSGYTYEVEIKISRSDFFADFKKEKHEIFRKIVSGVSYYFKNCGPSRWGGEIICRYKKATLERSRRNRFEDKESVEHYDYINQYKYWYLNETWAEVRAACTRIEFIDLTKICCPNRFYYAVPSGLIRKEEIPVYAGLIYIENGEAIIIKEAPFIHKRNIDLSKTLLEKFYWERNELRMKLAYIKKEF